MRAALLILCVVVAIGCGRNGSTAPATVTGPSPAITSPGGVMKGTVSDTAFHRIAGAEAAPAKYLMIAISAEGTVDPEHPKTITMQANGRISYCAVDAASGVFDDCLCGATSNCDSHHHNIVLTRR